MVEISKPTATTPAAEKAGPSFDFNGVHYNLKDFANPQQTDVIYNQLPADYKKQADYLAQVIINYQKVVDVAKANGINDPMQLVRDYANALGPDGKIKEGFDAATKALFEELDKNGVSVENAFMMVFGKKPVRVAQGAATVSEFVLGAAGSAISGLVEGPGITLDILSSVIDGGSELLSGGGKPISPESAKAFATLVSAMRLDILQKRQQLQLWDVPFMGGPAQLTWGTTYQYGRAAVDFGAEWAAQNLPKEWVVRFIAGVQYAWANITTFGKTETTWEQALEDANKYVSGLKPADYNRFAELAAGRMFNSDGAVVAKKLKEQKELFGISMENGVPEAATTDKSTGQAANGDDIAVDLQKGTTVKTGDWVSRNVQPIVDKIPGDTLVEKTIAGAVGVGVTVVAGAKVLEGAAEGVVRHQYGPKSGPAKRLGKAEVALKTAQSELDVAKAGLEKARGEPGADTVKAENRVTSAENKVAKAEARVDDMKPKAVRSTAALSPRVAHASEDLAKGFWSHIYHSPRIVGRKIGGAFGWLLEQTSHGVSRIGEGVPLLLSAKALKGATLTLKGVGHMIPGVAAGVMGWEIIYGVPDAKAAPVNGQQLSCLEQLKHDFYVLKKMSPEKFELLAALQIAYIASGLGGFVTAGGVEALHNGADAISKEDIRNYFPESLTKALTGKTVGEMVAGGDDAPVPQPKQAAKAAPAPQKTAAAKQPDIAINTEKLAGQKAENKFASIDGVKTAAVGMRNAKVAIGATMLPTDNVTHGDPKGSVPGAQLDTTVYHA